MKRENETYLEIYPRCEGSTTTLASCVKIALWEGNVDTSKRSQVACEIKYHTFITFYLILIIKVSRNMF